LNTKIETFQVWSEEFEFVAPPHSTLAKRKGRGNIDLKQEEQRRVKSWV
jgi:hypothetical protein